MPGSEEFDLAAFFEHHPIPLYASSRDGRFLAANAATRELLGLDDPDNAHAEQVYREPAERTRVIRELDDNPDIEFVDWEQALRVGSGLQWIRPITRVVRDESGRVLRLEGGLFKGQGDDRADLDVWLRMVLEHTNDPVFLLDKDSRMVWANREGRHLLGTTETTLRPHSLFEELIETDAPVADWLRNTPFRGEVRFRVDGEDHHHWINLEAHLDQHGEPAFYSILARDLSRTDLAVKRFADESIQRQQLLSTVAHEIRTPLSSVLGLALELERLLAEAGVEHADLARVISEQASDIERIVRDLVESSASGPLPTEIAVVDLEMVATGALASSPVAGKAEIVGTGRALGDPTRVRQIIRNLLTNADRYGRPPIQIEIEVAETALVSVIDHGDGVPEMLTDRVFEPFTSHGGDGHAALGLGLSIAHTLARQMGGSLSYAREGDATRFTLELPIA